MNAPKIDLASRAMLVTLSVSVWPAVRTDKKVSAEVAFQHNVTEARAGRYRKNCIDTKAPEYVAVLEAYNAMRQEHYRLTLPFANDGARMLAAQAHPEYAETMRRLGAIASAKADAFAREFPRLVENARTELNGMFNRDDYPTDVRAKFGHKVSVIPVPTADDFRVTVIGEAAAEEIKGSIERDMQEAATVAMQDPYTRLYKHIERMVERLSQPEAIFRDSLITGLNDLCTLLPMLNVTGDATLQTLADRAALMVSGIEPQDIRDNPAVRSEVANKAAEIERIMSGMMRA